MTGSSGGTVSGGMVSPFGREPRIALDWTETKEPGADQTQARPMPGRIFAME